MENKSSEDYSEYTSLNTFIKVNITEHILKKEDTFPFSTYALYKISIISNLKEWSIWKRYSDFLILNENLTKYNISLPEFPEKKIFNTSDTIISERKDKLAAFLNFFLVKEKIFCFPEILAFLEIDKDILNLLVYKTNIHSFSHKGSVSDSSANYFTQFLEYTINEQSSLTTNSRTAYMQLIDEFLKNLEQQPFNKSSIVRLFENFLKSKKAFPSFKTDEIYKLFFGEYSNKECILKGLLSQIWNIEENEYGAEESLYFLLKLLDCEFNPEFEKYTNILKTMKITQFDSKGLMILLKSNKTKTKKSALKLLDIIYEEHNHRMKDALIECGAMEVYESYLNNGKII